MKGYRHQRVHADKLNNANSVRVRGASTSVVAAPMGAMSIFTQLERVILTMRNRVIVKGDKDSKKAMSKCILIREQGSGCCEYQTLGANVSTRMRVGV